MFYLSYQQWFAYLALLAVAGLPWLSLLLSLPGMLTLRTGPKAPDRVRMGVPAEAVLVGTTRFPIPMFRGRLRMTRVTTGEVWKRKKGTQLPTDHCGAITVTPCRVRVYDYLGLFRLPKRKNESRTVIVRPVPVKMEAPPDLSRYLAQVWRPKPGGGFSENHELRLYRPGDSLSHVHWKLTAKTGKLILREPQEPIRGLMLLTMDVNGTAAELDDKFGRLLWLGMYLLDKHIPFQLHALTAEGVSAHSIAGEGELNEAVDRLLCCGPAAEGSIRERKIAASWRYHIGGGEDEA